MKAIGNGVKEETLVNVDRGRQLRNGLNNLAGIKAGDINQILLTLLT